MGTVTQANPLRIRLDGDTISLPYTPARLISTWVPEVNQRVVMAVIAKRYCVVGAVGSVDPEIVSNDYGTYTKWSNRRLECRISIITLTYLNNANLRATWTFPAAFSTTAYTIQQTALTAGPVAGRIGQNVVSSRATTYAIIDRNAPAGTYVEGDTQGFTLLAVGEY